MKKTLLTAAVTGAGFFSQIYANQADSTAVFRTSDLQEVVVSVNRDRIHKINSPQHIVSIPKSLIDYTNQQNTAGHGCQTEGPLIQAEAHDHE